MKVVCISDTHNRHRELELPTGDVLIHAGDFTDFGRPNEIEDFVQWFASLKYPHKVLIAGNHDFFMYDILPESVTKNKEFTYLRNESTVINGLQIYGCPDTLSYHIKTLEWSHIPTDTDILVTHSPPLGIGDPNHLGCPHLLERVCTIKPLVHVYGHIHEGYGVYKQDGCSFINASIESQELNIPLVVTIDQ